MNKILLSIIVDEIHRLMDIMDSDETSDMLDALYVNLMLKMLYQLAAGEMLLQEFFFQLEPAPQPIKEYYNHLLNITR